MNKKIKDENLVYPDGQKPKSQQGTIVLVSILLLLLALGAIGYSWFLFSKNTEPQQIPGISDAEKNEIAMRLIDLYKSEGGPVAPEGVDPLNYGLEATGVASPSGHLIFSSKQKPYTEDVKIFALDVTSSTSVPRVLLSEYETSAMGQFNDQNKPTDVFFLGPASLSSTTINSDDGTNIFNYNLETKNLKSFTSAEGLNKRNFEWSSTNHLLAFNRLSVKEGTFIDLIPVENWEIVIIDTETDILVDVIEGARSPRWSPDGTQLLYLRSDGLFIYDMQSKQPTKIIPALDGSKVLSSSMIDVSPDGTHLIWTSAKIGLITVYKINSWKDENGLFSSAEIGRLHVPDTEFYWPQFSHDGLQYAVQAIDTLKEGADERENGRIEIRQLEGRDIIYTYSLSDFAFNLLFTDDWIANVE